MLSGMFMYADADLKFDQPQAEVLFDRDKLRSQGVDLSQAGRDLSVLLGGNYVNRFSIQGRSYKVIPQVQRAERLTPDQLSQIYITGSNDKLVPLSTFASLRTDRRAERAEEIPAAQRRTDSGRDPAACSARQGARVSRERSQSASASGLSRSITPASRVSFERKARSSSPPSCSPRS
jgi:multidrug efflux pump